MGEPTGKPPLLPKWSATFDENERRLLERTLSATPAQRLAWLEEALELAHRSGALKMRVVLTRQDDAPKTPKERRA